MGCEALAMLWSRRDFLVLTGACVWAPTLAARAEVEDELTAFLELSRRVTGFAELDVELGRRYWAALSSWEPDLGRLLRGGAIPATRERAVVELVIESWYSGAVATARGTETVTFEGALAWACLPRSTPVTFCHP